MGLIDFFRENKKLEKLKIDDNDIVSMADGQIIDVTKLPDAVFSKQMLGKSIAFEYNEDKVMICSPANGTVSMLFPTGHTFGITTNEGVELLVHIGIDTVRQNGEGFKVKPISQGDKINAGDPVVSVDMKKLKKKYDMSVILIVTNSNNKQIDFIGFQEIKRCQSLLRK